MSKLSIPASVFIGTPLSLEDLKQIIGGSTHECFCTWKINESTTKKESPKEEIWTQEMCEKQCIALCSVDPACESATTHYSMNP